MKKLIALGLAACMTFSLAGCSGSASKETEAASAAETTAAASTGAETSAAASDTATSIDKLTVTYVTSPLNVPTIIEKDQGIFEKELGVPDEKLNVNGGGISLGHPVGATGSRIVITLMYELKRRKQRYGVATLCAGGGMGTTVVIEMCE